MELPVLCDKYFYSFNLYDALSVNRNTDQTTLKHSYFKRSLAFLPLRNINKDEYSEAREEKFKILFQIYSILSDKERKWVYDTSGCVWLDDQLTKKEVDWIGYWKLTFGNPSDESIEDFVNKYRGSEEEAADIKSLFKLYNGNVKKIKAIVLCWTKEDESRIDDIIYLYKALHNCLPTFQVIRYPSISKENDSKPVKQQKKSNNEKLIRKILEAAFQNNRQYFRPT